MRSTILTAALAVAMSFAANAQSEIIKIEFNNGEVQTFNVDDIKEIVFGEAQAPTIAGTYSGTEEIAVGNMATYSADIAVVITENPDGTINYTVPQTSFLGTVMGDLELGSITLEGIPYDEAKGAYYLDYSDKGWTQHFKSSSGLDSDYVLGATSEITITVTADGISVLNPFKLGNMPFDLTATFKGKK